MKVIIPVAGLGSRLKPHTFTTPKPLMDVAGKPMLNYVIDTVKQLNPNEIILVVGYKKNSIIEHVEKSYPHSKFKFIEQKKRDGDGSAVRIALDDIHHDDELVIVFGDTLIDFDLKNSLEKKGNTDAIVFAKEVEEPQNYGVLNVKDNLEIYEVEEKPVIPKSNLAIIGAYYFNSLHQVKKILDENYKNQVSIKGEYRIVQVIEKYINSRSLGIKASKVRNWFDCGRVEILLNSNKYFLDKKTKNKTQSQKNFIIVPPCYIPKTAKIKNSIVGPYVSLGENVILENSIIENSIIGSNSTLTNMILKDSLIGKEVILKEKRNKINIGDKSQILLE